MTTEASGRTRLRIARGAHYWAELVVVVVIGLALLATLFSELYFAWLVMLSRALHHGYWPFLNRYCVAGSLPFVPLESGAMYPVTLLAAAVSAEL